MPATRFHPFRTLFRPAALAGLLALLAACGGGGDDAGGDPAAQALVITGSNAEAVTADALQATSTAAASSIASMLAMVPEQSMEMATVPGQSVMAVEIDETRICIYGGKYYVKGSVASTSAITVGDKITFTAQGCRADPIYTLNGGLGFSVLAGGVTSNPSSPYSVTVQVDALNLSLDQSGYSQTLAGDTRVVASSDSATYESAVLSGNSLRYSTPTYSYTLKNYQQTLFADSSGGNGTTTATVVTSNPMLGATVTYYVSTPAALVVDTSGNVIAGSLKVVSGSTTLLATVTAVNVFTIQVDTNGDGVYDQTQTATVAELQAMR